MEPSQSIRERVFVVGCARSGTTLVQAMLASHSRVFSFPESHFFCRAVPRRRRHRLLGLADRRAAQAVLRELTTLTGRPDLETLLPRRSPMFRSYSRAFVDIIDRATAGNGKDIWVEKTPHHVDFLPVIPRFVPGAKFVHVLRDGRDVVASQIDAQREDPGYWGSWSIERLVNLWNADTGRSVSYRGQPAHCLLSYEKLLEDPEPELRRVASFIGFEFERSMLEHWRNADQVVGWRRSHPWMQTAYKPLQDTRLKKFERVFTDQEKSYITTHLRWGGRVAEALGWESRSLTPAS